MSYNLENERLIKFICPICKKAKELKLSTSIISDNTNLTTISIQKNEVCEHHFQAFIDKQFKIRGYQKVDFEIGTKIKLPKGDLCLKVIIIGDYKVGKSAIARRFVENEFSLGYLPTLQLSITKKTLSIEDTNINFVIWDIGGQVTSMSPYRDQFYYGANTGIIVIDRTIKTTLENAEMWYFDAKETIENNIPFILAGNKSDLENEIVLSEQDIADKADMHGFDYILTSAKSGENVEELFLNLAMMYFKHRDRY